MTRKLLTAVALTLVLLTVFSQGGTQTVPSRSQGSQGSQSQPQTELIDIKANLVFPYEINDSTSVLCLVGEFAAHHNGAVITADSAVRYNDERLECFGRVLINKNTTYAYADRAEYDGARNVASLYSQIVKVVDEDVTLYTYNFTFNTLDNVGRYWGGGVTTKRAAEADGEAVEQVRMESREGYYYADTKQVVGVREVELRGEGYELSGDSVIYEMQAERAHFFEDTNIWNENGDYLSGDRGVYNKELALFRVTRKSYLLTAEQEIWSDSMEYRREVEEATLWQNIQIDDTTNKSLAFGDFGEYWGEIERVLLTRRPALINYDPQEVDSLFMRADTIELLSYPVGTGPIVDSAEIRRVEELKARMAAATQSVVDAGGEVSEEVMAEVEEILHTDSLEMPVVVDSLDMQEADTAYTQVVEIKKQNLFSRLKSIFRSDSTAKAERLQATQQKIEAKEAERAEKAAIALDAERAREYRDLSKRRDKIEQRIAKRTAKGRSIYSDSMQLISVINDLNSVYDTVSKTSIVDSLAVIDSLRGLIAAMSEEDLVERDSLYRIIKAFRNVKSYRVDFQMVCDSLVSISYDSTMRLYIAPVLWNDNNQTTAEQIDLYTLDGALDYADLFGDPIMSSEVISGDSIYYNQIKGKTMKMTFEENTLKKNDVNANVQTIYYLQDEETGLVNTIAKIESGSATFFIEEQTLDGVTYRAQPTYVFAPLDKVPADLPYNLDGFVWCVDQRPTRDSIFDRTIRPTVREVKSSIPRPEFPIMVTMDKKRSELERKRSWYDRIEQVSPVAAEWMQALGYTPGQPREESPF